MQHKKAIFTITIGALSIISIVLIIYLAYEYNKDHSRRMSSQHDLPLETSLTINNTQKKTISPSQTIEQQNPLTRPTPQLVT